MALLLELKKPGCRYAPGEIVEGVATVTTANEEDVRAIFVTVHGVTYVEWRNIQPRGNNPVQIFRSHAKAQEHKMVLLGEIEGPPVKLTAGTHTYNFSFQLPESIPGSFKLDDVELKYTMQLVMNIPFSVDRLFEVPIEISNILDLNKDPSLIKPLEAEESQCFYVWSLLNHTIHFSVSIPQGGFVAGQEIPILCKVTNPTRLRLRGMHFVLQRRLFLKATSPWNAETNIQRKHNEAELKHLFTNVDVPDNSSITFKGVLKVPYNCAVYSPPSPNFRMKHTIKVRFLMGEFTTDKILRIPVKIGTVSIGGVHVPTAPEEPGPSAPLLGESNEKEAPPPSYDDLDKSKAKEAEANSGGVGWQVQ